jgi:hypothetical protein
MLTGATALTTAAAAARRKIWNCISKRVYCKQIFIYRRRIGGAKKVGSIKRATVSSKRAT